LRTFALANKNYVLRRIPCAAIILCAAKRRILLAPSCLLKSKILKGTKSNILKKSLELMVLRNKIKAQQIFLILLRETKRAVCATSTTAC
jgi:hypothetical protein